MDHRRLLLLSILYQLVWCLLGLTVVLVRRDLSKDAELLFLRHDNAVLRRQIARVHCTPANRTWLAALSRLLLPRRRWAEVLPVTPATIVAWHRKLVHPPQRGLAGSHHPFWAGSSEPATSSGSSNVSCLSIGRRTRSGVAGVLQDRSHRAALPAIGRPVAVLVRPTRRRTQDCGPVQAVGDRPSPLPSRCSAKIRNKVDNALDRVRRYHRVDVVALLGVRQVVTRMENNGWRSS